MTALRAAALSWYRTVRCTALGHRWVNPRESLALCIDCHEIRDLVRGDS